jgi:transcription antitermination factor NusG
VQFSHDNTNWYAVQVRPARETLAKLHLEQRGYELFLPQYTVRRRWSDRWKVLQQPLFPGYLFCRCGPTTHGRIVDTPCVIRVVGNEHNPVPVDALEIESLQRIVASDCRFQERRYLQAGQLVRVETGPLRGAVGILVSIKNSRRLVVSISLLLRSIAAELDCCEVTPIDSVRINCTKQE